MLKSPKQGHCFKGQRLLAHGFLLWDQPASGMLLQQGLKGWGQGTALQEASVLWVQDCTAQCVNMALGHIEAAVT